MNKFGGWNVNVPHDGKYPQKLASTVFEMNNKVGFGCEYDPICYLANQEVNGINHAVLMQQTVENGKDINNAVIVVFNEKPGSMDLSMTSIRAIVESGGPLGGVRVNMSLDIPKEAQDAFNTVLDGWTGLKIAPFAYVGDQTTKGINYVLVADISRVVTNATHDLALVTVNTLEKKFYFERVFEIGANDNKEEISKLGYAFTW